MSSKQGIALRGHRETADLEDPSRNRGNLLAFLELISEYDPVVHVRLTDGANNAKYTQHSIQDDILRSAAALVTEDIVREINEAGMFSLQADETKDLAKVEQLSLCLRYVKDDQNKERFIRFTA